jgi:hypothetical protein
MSMQLDSLRRGPRPGLCLFFLALACVLGQAECVPAQAAANESGFVLAAAASASGQAVPLGTFAFWNSVLGNQTRMIQVGLVIIAIGIFILTRSIR